MTEDRAVVGAYANDDTGFNSGSIYIYDRINSNWTETKLTASDAASDDEFGRSVAAHYNRVLAGTPGDDDNGSSSGSVYIFDWNGVSWLETKVSASDGSADDLFGRDVSAHGSRILVGASGDDDNGSSSGSIYVYDWDGANWIETKIISSDGSANDLFGRSVSIDMDRIVVGCTGDDDHGTDSGSAYVYDWNGATWVESKLTASDASSYDYFGSDVDIYGDRIIVGSESDDDNGSGSGSAYVYDWNGVTWVETKLSASDGAASDDFGWSVALDKHKAVVGAYADDDNGNSSGSLYLYEFDGVDWKEKKTIASDGLDNDFFGWSVAIHGNRAIAGAYSDDDNGPISGSAYIYDYNLCELGTIVNTFQDVGSGLWTDASNWSKGTVPGPCHRVVIPDGESVLLLNNEEAECYTFEVVQGGNFTAEDGAIFTVRTNKIQD